MQGQMRSEIAVQVCNFKKTNYLKKSSLLVGLLICFFCIAYSQDNNDNDKPPVFRQVSYPFLPSVTHSYFFFSEDGLMWFSTARGLTSFDGAEAVYHSSLQEANELG